MSGYIARVREEITGVADLAASLGADFDRKVDSIYVGGGTPTTLSPSDLANVFVCIRSEFEVLPEAEITVECAPGTLHSEILSTLLKAGTNRVSLGAQSFIDEEARAVGRLHTAKQALADIVHLRESGIDNISVDLIAGLPHQTRESWRISLQQLTSSGVPHASVYILEIDDDSRLGRELIAGGARYHAHHVPDSDLAADLYVEATSALASAGLNQYEISNFARPGRHSHHNLKYWTREPYLGFGLDAHSMLQAKSGSEFESVRFNNTDDLQEYITNSGAVSVERVRSRQAAEEHIFLGLRLNRGIDLATVKPELLRAYNSEISELAALGLVEQTRDTLRLTARGQLLSNEVFERFITTKELA